MKTVLMCLACCVCFAAVAGCAPAGKGKSELEYRPEGKGKSEMEYRPANPPSYDSSAASTTAAKMIAPVR